VSLPVSCGERGREPPGDLQTWSGASVGSPAGRSRRGVVDLEVVVSLRVLFSAAAICGLLLGVRVGMAGSERAVDTRQLTKERMGAARDAYQLAWNEFRPFDLSKGDGEKVYRWSRRWMEAERELANTKAERAAALQAHFERMKKLEEEVQAYARGTIPFQQLAATRFYRAEAEGWLGEAKSK
jgi:hypothetical protein